MARRSQVLSLLSPDFITLKGAPQVRAFFARRGYFHLKPLANLASGVPKPNYPRLDPRYSFAGALVILAVAIGTGLVLLVDWLYTLPNPFTR
jgi:hypothetical protein